MQVADLHRAAASSKPHFDISAIDIFTMQGCNGLLCFTTISLSMCVCSERGGVCSGRVGCAVRGVGCAVRGVEEGGVESTGDRQIKAPVISCEKEAKKRW